MGRERRYPYLWGLTENSDFSVQRIRQIKISMPGKAKFPGHTIPKEKASAPERSICSRDGNKFSINCEKSVVVLPITVYNISKSEVASVKFLSVAETAQKWGLSERAVRNYCAQGRVIDAFMTGGTWNIPETAEKPERKSKAKKAPSTLLEVLRREKASKLSGGIYHKIQVDLTYNSNHIEGSRLTHDQTRYIFETNTIGITEQGVNVDDVIETVNHFHCIDMVIDQANRPLSEHFIKQLHAVLKNNSSDSRNDWFAIGEYKRLPNEVGGKQTVLPENVASEMQMLLSEYNQTAHKTLEDVVEFHAHFEAIHPFQDGNGRVGRLIMFKECLRNNIVPFIITDDLKMFYYRGLQEWNREKGYLLDTCLTAQDRFLTVLDYFRCPYLR